MVLVTVLTPYNNTELYEYASGHLFIKKEGKPKQRERTMSKTALLEHCAWELQ